MDNLTKLVEKPNFSNFDRPLLLYVLSSGDSVPYTPQPLKSKYEQIIVRGEYNNRIRCDSGEYVIPPNWSNGYSSIFALQQKENRSWLMYFNCDISLIYYTGKLWKKNLS